MPDKDEPIVIPEPSPSEPIEPQTNDWPSVPLTPSEYMKKGTDDDYVKK